MFTVAVGLVIAVGVLGTLVPILPGPFLVWGAALTYGLVKGFDPIGWTALGFITAGLIAAVYLGFRLPQQSAAAEGLGLGAQTFALALAIIGFFLVPVVGAGLGFVAGVWVVRYRQIGDTGAANRSTLMTIRGLLKAAAAQFGCAVGMAGAWLIWVVIG